MEVKRKRGRPKKYQQTLSREIIVAATLKLLDDPASSASLHGVARALGVDPMALYTYFESWDDLIQTVAVEAFSTLSDVIKPTDSWRENTKALILHYLNLHLRKPGLLTSVLRLGAAATGPASVFRTQFMRAISPLEMSPHQAHLVEYLLVDYTNGFALAAAVSEHGTITVSDAERIVDFYLDCLESAIRTT